MEPDKVKYTAPVPFVNDKLWPPYLIQEIPNIIFKLLSQEIQTLTAEKNAIKRLDKWKNTWFILLTHC